MTPAASDFIIIPFGFGLASALLWVVSLASRRKPSAGPEVVAQAQTAIAALLAAVGWIVILMSSRTKKPHSPEITVCFASLAGLAVATVAIRIGVRLELRRLGSTGQGTPRGAMAKRVALFFSSLTFIVGIMLACRAFPRTAAVLTMSGLSALWVPAAIAWLRWPGAGPAQPRRSAAYRATFFALAVSALVSLATPWLLGSPAGVGFLAGVWASAALLLSAGWVAAWGGPRLAVLVAGVGGSLAGFYLLRSI